MTKCRKIIHIDMDAFYASVEQRDCPALRGKPVIVGGDPQKRGVVAACSYEARKFGIHSAMPGKTAYRRCPHAVFLRPRFDVYRAVSSSIREIFFEYTDYVEPLSLDEAYLDVTENKKYIPYAVQAAENIRKIIFERTGLTASAGVSFNKFLAKVASDMNKPNGITVITPSQAGEFIDRLPIRKFFGVGQATEKKMLGLGIHTGADLKRFSLHELISYFGKSGQYFYDIANGKDNRCVNPDRVRKSIGKETTFEQDMTNTMKMLKILESIANRLEKMIQNGLMRGITLTLKVKYADFQTVTRSITLAEPIVRADVMMFHISQLLTKTEAGKKKVRLLGISISNFEGVQHPAKHKQLSLPFHNTTKIDSLDKSAGSSIF